MPAMWLLVITHVEIYNKSKQNKKYKMYSLKKKRALGARLMLRDKIKGEREERKTKERSCLQM